MARSLMYLGVVGWCSAACLAQPQRTDNPPFDTIPVIKTGDPTGVGTSVFTAFSTTSGPFINDNGLVAFIGQMSGQPNGSDEGIWIGTRCGDLEFVAQEGDPMPGNDPGDSGVTIRAFGIAAFTNEEDVLLNVDLSGPGVNQLNNEAILLWREGTLYKVVREGDPWAFPAGTVRSQVARMGDDGTIGLFAAGAGTPTWNEGIVKGPPPLTPVAHRGAQIQGLPSEFTWSRVRRPTVNAHGDVGFFGIIRQNGTAISDGMYVYTEDDELIEIANSNDPTPAPGTTSWGMGMGRPYINSNRNIIFGATSGATDLILYATNYSPDTLATVTATGLEAPGTNGESFRNLNLARVYLNALDHIAFHADIDNAGNDNGIWAGEPHDLQLVAIEGQNANVPGLDAAMGNGGWTSPGQGFRPILSQTCLIAFMWTLVGNDVSGNGDNDALFVFDLNGPHGDGRQRWILARENDEIDLDPSASGQDIRRIGFNDVRAHDTLGSAGGAAGSFNLWGHLAFHLSFTDASEAILVAVPTHCPADINVDGIQNTSDFVQFLNLFTSQSPVADWNRDCILNTTDFIAFLSDYNIPGCQ